MTSDGLTQHEPDLTVPELPQHILDTYARLWQLETWLRRLVYVELKAFAGDDWASKIRNAEKPTEKDKRLSHMPIPEESPLSYAQFSELCRILSEDWQLFKPFLPPQSIWTAKLEEVAQIRHRIAHFRSVHRNDLDRVVQLLRDIDDGFQRFCMSYNDPHPVFPASEDPVVEHFLPLDPFPWGLLENGSLMRLGSADPQARLGVTVEVLRRPWACWSTPVAGKKGLIYVVTVSARPVRPNQAFDYQGFLTMTAKANLHEHFIHARLDHTTIFRITLPALLGADESIRIIEEVVAAAGNCLRSSYSQHSNNDSLKKLANEWPEYVLGPEDWLAFLAPNIPCHSLFGFEQS